MVTVIRKSSMSQKSEGASQISDPANFTASHLAAVRSGNSTPSSSRMLVRPQRGNGNAALCTPDRTMRNAASGTKEPVVTASTGWALTRYLM